MCGFNIFWYMLGNSSLIYHANLMYKYIWYVRVVYTLAWHWYNTNILYKNRLQGDYDWLLTTELPNFRTKKAPWVSFDIINVVEVVICSETRIVVGEEKSRTSFLSSLLPYLAFWAIFCFLHPSSIVLNCEQCSQKRYTYMNVILNLCRAFTRTTTRTTWQIT